MKKNVMLIVIVAFIIATIVFIIGKSGVQQNVVGEFSPVETFSPTFYTGGTIDVPSYFYISKPIKGTPFSTVVENGAVEENIELTQPEIVENAKTKFDFGSTLFIGDSIFVGLEKYLIDTNNEDMSSAVFFANGGFAIRHNRQTVNESSTHPKLNGEKMKISKAVKTTDKDNLFIMMGTNDLVVNTPSTAKSDFATLMGAILDVNPGMKVHIIESVVPVNGKNNEKLTCDTAKEYNGLLKSYAEDKGYTYIELPEILFDESGCLKEEYSSDGFLHLNDNAYKMIVDKLSYIE